MAEIINYDRSYRYIFEPFHPWEVESFRHFGLRRYLRPGSQDSRFLDCIDAVLRGDMHSYWTDLQHCENKRIFFQRRLIKTVRANLFLGWMRNAYPQTPVILAVRHPCATTCSIMKKEWPPTLPAMMEQATLISDLLEPHLDVISDAKTILEKHIVSWCIDYYVVLTQLLPGEIHLLFYENLIQDPDDEIARLFDFLGRGYDDRVINQLGAPSVTATRESRRAIEAGDALLGRWREQLTQSEIGRCMSFVRAFGLDQVYPDLSMPSREGALAFMRENQV